jgi:Glycosyl hydrolases family 16
MSLSSRCAGWSRLAAPLAVLLPLTVLPSAVADHANPPGPVNAQSTFLWGRPLWQDDFESSQMPSFYRVEGRGLVQNQFGMLTLNTGTAGTVTATRDRAGHTEGRWEIRLRSRRYATTAADFRVRTELVPAGGHEQRCGARDIALESYRLGGRRAHLWIRNLPDREFTASKRLGLGDDRWHTFAVEVTPARVSWFVDAHVIRTERRPEALSGVPLTVRFTMLAEPGAQMNRSRMQMDWLRYFTLDRPNARSVDAPQPDAGTYAAAC